MAELQIMNQPQAESEKKLGTVQIPLTLDTTSTYFKYFNASTFTWTFPVPLLHGRYRFKLTKLDVAQRTNNPTDNLQIISPQLKMLFSPAQDMIVTLNNQRPFFDPIQYPIEFIANCDGVLNFQVWSNIIGTFPQFLINVILTYNIYLI